MPCLSPFQTRSLAASLRGLLGVAGLCAAAAAQALPVTVTTPFMNLENRAVNSLGFIVGEYLRIGANSVSPNTLAGTVAIGTSVNAVTGAPLSVTLGSDASPLSPNMTARYFVDRAAVRNPWTLSFTNGTNTTRTTVSLPQGTTQAPFVNTITLSGTAANPTFTWTAPPATTVNGYRINIYDKALINTNAANGPLNSGNVVSINVGPTTTSHTVSAADFTAAGYSFQQNRNYSIEISLIQTKDGSSTNLGNGNLKAIARSYADFTATAGTSPIVNLPVTLANGSFQFNVAVVPGQTYYLDPAVATGYDFATGAGDPNFASVVLPTGIGDGLYDLYGFGVGDQAVLLAHDLAGGSVFGFGGTGVSRFRVGGIEVSAGLDPLSTTAFVTGVTFERAGLFTGTQTPLTTEITVAVPEPAHWALLLAGLGAVGFAARRSARGEPAGAVR